MVVTYSYDAWGKVLSVTGSLASTVGQINPFRYRGYYYDTETGFYYLQTRYYDPTVGRLLNADGYVSTGQGILGNNMFAYCGNNPVIFCDPNGETFLPFFDLLWCGEIHLAVQWNIIDRYGGKMEITMEGLRLRADLLIEGKLYEVKPVTWRAPDKMLKATKQLDDYVQGFDYQYERGNKTMNNNFFYQSVNGTIYYVNYFSRGDGLIYYSFVAAKPEQLKDAVVERPVTERAKSKSAQKSNSRNTHAHETGNAVGVSAASSAAALLLIYMVARYGGGNRQAVAVNAYS